MKNKRKIGALLLFAVLLFTFLILYRNVFLKNEVIIPGDIPYNTPVWQGEAPDRKYYKADNYLLSDQINQFYAWHHIAHISMSGTGIIPLWNPYIFGGQPLVANSQSSLFYPPNLLLFYFEPGTIATVRAFFNIFILILFGFLAGRQLGISRIGSVMISAGLALSGPVTVWLGHPHANVFSWFPFLVWSGEKVIATEKKIFWSGIFGLGAGISLLGGHPEMVFHLFLIVSVYLFLRLLFSGKVTKKKRTSSILLVTGLISGILIGSVQLIPFSDFLFKSATYMQGGRGEHDGPLLWSGSAIPNLTGIPTLVYPDFFGNPPDRTFMNPVDKNLNYNEQAIYFGLIPLSFFIFVIFRRGSPLIIKILTYVSLFSLGIAWRLPFFEVFNHIPVFSIVTNGRLRIFFAFIAVFLAGFGLDLFRKKYTSGELKNRNILRFALIPLIAISVFVVFSMIKSFMQISGQSPFQASTGEFSFLKYLIFGIFTPDNPGIMITIISSLSVLIILFLLKKKKIGILVFEISIVIICIIDLAVPASGYNPTIKNEDILPYPSVFSSLKGGDEPFRTIATGNMMLQNYNCVHGIQLMGGYDLPVFRRYSELFFSQNNGDLHNHNWHDNSELVNFLNIRYFFSKGDYSPVSSKYELIFDNLNYRVYENREAFPRVFMTYDYEVTGDMKESLSFLKGNDFKLKDKVLLNSSPDILFKRFPSSSDVPNNVRITEYINDEVNIHVYTESAGILVMSDVMMSGWKVYVDGVSEKIFYANYAFRGVFIPSGSHSVVFKYEPVPFRAGLLLTYAGLLSVLLFILFGLFRKQDGDSPDHT
ncbi:MAG: YfhO family protein [Acidobacteriota bacterium]